MDAHHKQQLIKHYKEQVHAHTTRLAELHKQGKLSTKEYKQQIKRDLGGKSPKYWMSLYDRQLKRCEKELSKLEQKKRGLTAWQLVIILLFLIASTAGVLFFLDQQYPFRADHVELLRSDQFSFTAKDTSVIAQPCLPVCASVGIPVNSVIINDMRFANGTQVSVEQQDISPASVPHRRIERAFSLNTNARYSSALFNITAAGTEVWQCTGKCTSWTKIKDIVPGQTYTLELTQPGTIFAETNIVIINVQSYPLVGGNWTVFFNTTGKENLSIRAVDGTSFVRDLSFVRIMCGRQEIPATQTADGIFVNDYSCNETGQEISTVLTPGRHHLEFTFGPYTAYAHNMAGSSGLVLFKNYIDITPAGIDAWTDIDVSSYVPEGATGVVLALLNTNTGNIRVLAKSPVSTDDFYSMNKDYILADGMQYTITPISAARHLEGIIDTVAGKIYLLGYTDEEVVLFDNQVNITSLYAGTGSWQTLNVNAWVPSSAKGLIMKLMTGANGNTIAVRPQGTASGWSTSQGIANGQYFSIVRQNSNSVDAYRSAATGYFLILGYFKSTAPVVLFDNPIDISQNNLSTWIDTNVTSSSSSKANNAILIRRSQRNGISRGQVRMVGSSNDWYADASIRNFQTPTELTALDENQTFQQIILHNTQDYYVNGYTEQQPFPPSIANLSYPQNDSYKNVNVTDFNFTAIHDDGNLTCTLFGNFSEAWAPNETITNVSNNTLTNITLTLPDSTYVWNVNCTDWFGQSAFYTSNYSFVIDTIPPAITAATLNESSINQSHKVRLNVTVQGASQVNATLRYPNSTTENITLTQAGTAWLANITKTNVTGLYNVSSVYAIDLAGNTNITTYASLTFTVLASPPAAFSLLTPPNQTVSANLNPNLTWQQTSDETFANYTLLVSTNSTFFNATTYVLTPITNTSYVVNDTLLPNRTYYWTVRAYDVFTSMTAAQNYTYKTDINAPAVTLNTPLPDSYETTEMVLFNITPIDENIANCTLFGNFNGTFGANATNTSVQNNTYTFFTVNLSDGIYLWNARCTDFADLTSFAVQNYTLYVDTHAPIIALEAPSSGSSETTTNNVLFTYNVTDVMSPVDSCTLIVDGVQAGIPDTSIAEGESQNFTVFVANGIHTWSVNCTDGRGFVGNSTANTLTVLVTIEYDPPFIIPHEPPDNNFSSTAQVFFNYTPTDASGITNCSILIDDAIILTNSSVINGQWSSFTTTLSEQEHAWNITCIDNSSYTQGFSDMRTLTIDLAPPTVQVHTPQDVTFVTTSLVGFNFTPVDMNLGNCTVYGNFSEVYGPNITTEAVNDTENVLNVTLPDNTYLWNVLCVDAAGWQNWTQNQTVYVDANAPLFLSTLNTPYTAIYSPGQAFHFNATIEDAFLDTVLFEENFSGPFSNHTPSQEGTLFFYNTTDIIPGQYVVRWYANDTLGRLTINSTMYTVDKHSTLLNLTLNGTDGNASINEDTAANLTIILLDPSSGNVSLYVEDLLVQTDQSPLTNISIFVYPGLYNITALYVENENYTEAAATHFLTVLDVTPPQITLLSPTNNSPTSINPVNFQYVVSDDSTLQNCSFFLDGAFQQANTSVEVGETLTFTKAVSNATHLWNITCLDSAGNTGKSSTFNFSMQEASTILVSVTTDRQSYEYGSFANIATNVTGQYGSAIQGATVTTDIIQGNSTIPWWNVSWARRKPILLSNALSENLALVPVIVNMTNLSGNISNCVDESRVVSHLGEVIPVEIIAGDDATFCLIKFLANATHDSVNEYNYTYYYNNSQAQDPEYASVRGVYSIFYDGFEAGSDFLFDNGACQYAYNRMCQNSTPWDGFFNCTETDAGNAYGICSTNDVNVVGARGLEASGGLDRNSANDGLNFKLNTSACGGTTCQQANLSYYQAAYSLDTASEGSAVFVYDNDNTLRQISNCTQGEGCATPASRSAMASVAEYVMSDICSVAGISCMENVFVRFASATTAAHTTNDYFGWDEVNLTGYLNTTTGLSGTGGQEQRFVQRFQNTTTLSGLAFAVFNTLNQSYANYSAVSHAELTFIGYNGSQFNITADATPPNTTLLLPALHSWTKNSTVAFSYIPHDAVAVMNCTLYIDGDFATDNTSILNDGVNNFTAAVSEGQHAWWVNCTDYSNNTNSSLPGNFTLDTVLPNASILGPQPGNQTKNGTIALSFTGTDDKGSMLNYSIFVDGAFQRSGNFTNASTVQENVSLSGSGVRNITVQVLDQAENAINTSLLIILDQQTPSILLHAPPNMTTQNTTLTFNFSFTDVYSPNASCTVIIDYMQIGTYALTNTSPYTVSVPGFTAGMHYWNVSCTDIAGNLGKSGTNYFIIDREGPLVVLDSPGNDSYRNASVTFFYNVSDSSTLGTCWLVLSNTKNASKAATAGRNNITATLTQGIYVWSVNCTDSGGNEANSSTRTITIDTTPPSTFNPASPPNQTVSSNLTINLSWQPSTDDYFSNYTLQIDDSSSFSSIDQSIVTTDTYSVVSLAANKNWYWRVVARDTVGNTRTSGYYVYTADTENPVVVLRAPLDNDTDPDGNVTFFYTLTDVSPSNCTLYTNSSGSWTNVSFANASSGLNWFAQTNISNVTFVWNVLCYDKQDNAAWGSSNRTVTISGPTTFYGNITLTSLLEIDNSPPVLSSMAMLSPIDLYAGTTRALECNATVTDDNGRDDIQNVNATFYLDTVSPTDPDNVTLHYSTVCSCVNNTLTSINCSCPFSIWYVAKNGTWRCNMTALDSAAIAYGVKPVTMNKLYALNVTEGIDYGNIEADNISAEVMANITNLGNVPLHVSVQGYGSSINDGLSFVCQNNNISSSFQRFSTNTSVFSEKTPINGSVQVIQDFQIPSTDNESSPYQNTMYWQAQAPTSSYGSCEGIVVFTAQA
ncbi:MAG: hypothetical protein V1725_03555 [archaeon]